MLTECNTPLTPADLLIVSINANGLNSPEKRSHAMRDFRSQRALVVYIQETHFQEGRAPSLTNSHYPVGFFSHNTEARSKGTAILFHKRIPFQLLDSVTDAGGRFIFVKGRIMNQTYTFANCYAPNKAQHKFLSTTLRALRDFAEGLVVLGGDFNLPLEPYWDTSAGRSSIPLHILRSCRSSLHNDRFADCWRTLHPTGKDFSFYAHSSQSYSRIDYLFVPQYYLSALRSATIGTATWSDHAPVTITLRSPMFKPTAPNWRLNDSLLSDPLVAEEGRQVLTDYFERNAVGDVSSPMVWEAHKCVIRGYFIRKGAERAKRCSADIRDLQQQISQVSSDHKRDGDPNTMALLTELRRSLAELLNTRYHRTYLRSKAFFHSHGDKSGRLLARMLAKKRSAAYIAKLRDKQGALQRLPVKLLQIVRDYYAALYDLQGTINPQDRARKRSDILSYLTKYSTKKVSRQTSDLLDRPLTIEELALALQTSKTGKSPGPDGLPIRYYKSYAAILFPHLLTALNDLTEGLQLPTQTLSANITILPKEGKDPELCTSYRPISLLNCDLKLFSKILADRLKPFLPALVHADQVGFVPGREARDNTMRTLQLMHHARRSSQALALLSTDAEKAFDRVDWDFISLSLTHIGLGPHLCTWIGALYGNTTARVCVNGVFTTPFAIRNGTRQGCPLSPLLFVVTLEPFLEAIRSNPDISG
uniref:Reverse transcriptase domain-containing protein n=1 Tax=Leptobrachium leishanense TaxID=445787 RepID=A0A8C5MCG1_9ANUR